jgi:hypothetical protein
MLRIVIELVPGGVGKPRELARIIMGNQSHLADRSDYVIAAREADNRLAGRATWESRGLIANHNRNQTVFAWWSAPLRGLESKPRSRHDERAFGWSASR